MKFIFLIISLIIGNVSFSQSSENSAVIDASNYYNYFNDVPGMSVNWLRECDAVPIIINEIIKDSIPYYTIAVGDLFKINDSTRFVVTVSIEKDGRAYGFLCEGIHGIPIDKPDRDFLTKHENVIYVQAEKNINGDVNFMRIDPIPKNIFLLKETCYWFQFDEKGTKYPVSKDIAKNILRQDIDNYLKNL